MITVAFPAGIVCTCRGQVMRRCARPSVTLRTVVHGRDLASERRGMKPIVAGSHVVAFPGPVARWWRRLLRGMRYGARGRPAQTRVAHGEVVHRLALG